MIFATALYYMAFSLLGFVAHLTKCLSTRAKYKPGYGIADYYRQFKFALWSSVILQFIVCLGVASGMGAVLFGDGAHYEVIVAMMGFNADSLAKWMQEHSPVKVNRK